MLVAVLTLFHTPGPVIELTGQCVRMQGIQGSHTGSHQCSGSSERSVLT